MNSNAVTCACGARLKKYGNQHGSGVKSLSDCGFKHFVKKSGTVDEVACALMPPTKPSKQTRPPSPPESYYSAVSSVRSGASQMPTNASAGVRAGGIPNISQTASAPPARMAPSDSSNSNANRAAPQIASFSPQPRVAPDADAFPTPPPRINTTTESTTTPPSLNRPTLIENQNGMVLGTPTSQKYVTVPQVVACVGKSKGYPDLVQAFYLVSNRLPGSNVAENLDKYVKMHSSTVSQVQRMSTKQTWSGQLREVNCYSPDEFIMVAKAVSTYVPKLFEKLALTDKSVHADIIAACQRCLNPVTQKVYSSMGSSSVTSEDFYDAASDTSELRRAHGGEYGGASAV